VSVTREIQKWRQFFFLSVVIIVSPCGALLN
jgi:hypothetical protein